MSQSSSPTKGKLILARDKPQNQFPLFKGQGKKIMSKTSPGFFTFKAKKSADANKPLEDILAVYRSSSQLKPKPNGQLTDHQSETTLFEESTCMYIKSLSRKNDLKLDPVNTGKSNDNNSAVISESKSPKSKTSENFFAFLSSNRRNNNNSANTTGGFPFILNKSATLKDPPMSGVAKMQTDDGDCTFEAFSNEYKRSFSVNKDVIKEVISPADKLRKTLSSLSKSPKKFKKTFQYTFVNHFKPVGLANFAVNINSYAKNTFDDDLSYDTTEDTNRKNMQQFKKRKLLLSSLLTPEMITSPKKDGANVEKILQGIDQEYTLSELGLKQSERSTNTFQADDIHITPQSATHTNTNNFVVNKQLQLGFSESKDTKRGYTIFKPHFIEHIRTGQNFFPKKNESPISPLIKNNVVSPSLRRTSTSRQVFLLYADFMKQHHLLTTKTSIPVYERYYDLNEAKREYDDFLMSAQKDLSCPTALKYASLVNGQSISHLGEVPSDCNLIILSHSLLIQARTRYLQYHNMKSISDEKWNLILYLLNAQTEESKIRYIISNELFNKKIVCNDDLDFSSLMKKKNISEAVQRAAPPENKYQSQINDTTSALQDLFKDEDPLRPPRQTAILKQYDEALAKIDKHFQSQHDTDKQRRARVIEQMFGEVDIFLRNRENGGAYINCLDELLDEAYPGRLENKDHKPTREDGSNPNNHTQEKTPDIIHRNIKNVKPEAVRVYNLVNDQNAPLYNLNIPKLQADSAFTRRELFKLYVKYKAVCATFGIKKEFKNEEFDPAMGFDRETFKENFTQFKVATDQMIDRIYLFGTEDDSRKMSWPKFLRLMMSVRAKSVKDKMALFLFLMDTDGNGNLSFTEVAAVCKSALHKFRSSKEDALMDSLADYFAKMIFQAVKLKEDAEIPLEKLRQIVDKGVDAVDILLSFAGANQAQDEDTLLDINAKEKKIPKVRLNKELENL